MAGNKNSGRQRGSTYNRRTNDEIALAARAQERAAQQEAQRVEDRRHYNNREKANAEAKRRLNVPGSKLLDNIPRSIPPPEILLPRIKRVVDLCANVKDDKTGEVFFSKAAWKQHFNTWTHMEKGCYSDKPGFNYYYFITTKSGNKTLMCVRGTSKLEGFHKHLREILPGFHTAPC